MAATATLRRVLTQSKPEVLCKLKASKNSTNTKWPHIDASTMTPWADFNLKTLNESYSHILDLEVSMEQLAGAPRAEHVLQGIEINNPNHMMHLTGWNDRVLRPTLGFAKQHLGLHTGVHLHHFVLMPTIPCHVRITNTHHPLHIDHFVALDDFTSPNLVIGLTRPPPNFQGRRLINHPKP